MVISYSVAKVMVDFFQPRVDRPLTEAEIEARGLVDIQATHDSGREQIVGTWLRQRIWRLRHSH